VKKYKPVTLLILDGWGIRAAETGNAVYLAKTPNIDSWLLHYERSILDAAGEEVGLTPGQMGNSEVGHLNIGAGRIVYQDISRIDRAISDGSFFTNSVLKQAYEGVKKNGSNLHLFGLVGPGGVHSHTRHLYALLKLAKKMEIEPIIHVITDGRDTPPTSGIDFVKELEHQLEELPGIIATVGGRYYAMDRDKRWERTLKAYDAYTLAEGQSAPSAREAVLQSYRDEITDEFIKPTIIKHEGRDLRIQNGDYLLFFNFRADRMRQIVKSFCLEDFDGFERKKTLHDIDIYTFTEYEDDLPVNVVFPKENVTNTLAEIVSKNHLIQFHAAETEKYGHVTFFLNGGREEPFEGEERLLVPSPRVATYDLQPEMSAYELTAKVMQRIKDHDDDLVVVNYANLDMVGHTGILEAGIKAAEAVDECAGKLVAAVLEKGGVVALTADHGNAEMMIDQIRNEPHTYHTTNPVSFLVIKNSYTLLKPRGRLADIAPTLLELLSLEKPDDMTGESLIENKE
jgi:2,3-bisphosphoglycerate-independent phosphoglycerate mutase